MIKGMALPLLLFPASLLSSVSTLLIPEITESVSNKNENAVKNAVERVFSVTSVTSFLISGVFLSLAYPLGKLVYDSTEVGYLIRALSPLIPFMYIDLIADGILKGLDKQNFLFKTNVADSLLRVVLVVILVPKFGMLGFLGIMFFSNLFTSILSVIKIVKSVKIKFNFKKYFLKPLFAVFTAAMISNSFLKSARHINILYIILVSGSMAILYFVILIFLGVIDLKSFCPQKEKK